MSTIINTNNSLDYNKLAKLKAKIQANMATDVERDEFMDMLYKNNDISDETYQNYKQTRYKQDTLMTGLAIAGVLLLISFLSKK